MKTKKSQETLNDFNHMFSELDKLMKGVHNTEYELEMLIRDVDYDAWDRGAFPDLYKEFPKGSGKTLRDYHVDTVSSLLQSAEKLRQFRNAVNTSNRQVRKVAHMSKIVKLLKFIGENPGCTRKQIREGTGISKNTLNMYLCSYYGYKEGNHRCARYNVTSGRWVPEKKAYFRTADYKPAKGRTIHTYFLNEAGKQKVKSELE